MPSLATGALLASVSAEMVIPPALVWDNSNMLPGVISRCFILSLIMVFTVSPKASFLPLPKRVWR
jgi:hypothetical protein